MTTLTLPMPSPASPKRSYDDTGLGNSFLPDSNSGELHESQPFQNLSGASQPSIYPNPMQSIETTSLPTSSTMPPSTNLSVAEKPAKRVKLSGEEKEAKRIEKEAKDRLKAEEKAKKEEEKAKKDAEKAVKDEERRKLKEAKEEQAKLKEEEKQKREDEKMKKARSQLRLNAFFQHSTNPSGNREESPTKSPTRPFESSPLSSRRSSIAEINTIELGQRSRSTSMQATPSKPKVSDYKRHFPPFFVQSHTTLAPRNRFHPDEETTLRTAEKLDGLIAQQDQDTQCSTDRVKGLFRLPSQRQQKPRKLVTLKEIIQKMNGSSTNPIDLTATKSDDVKSLIALSKIKVKYLKFAEDVRPPYIGTYSKEPKNGSIHSLAKKPFSRVRPDTNYDWDSEAEWEDAVDGEDIESDGEEEEEEEDEEEMAGFLDDEDANAVKRRPLLGDQEPQCTGICWEGESLTSDGKPRPSLNSYRIDILLENFDLPIDPFSTSYWSPKPLPSNPSSRTLHNQQSLMEPPRIPLSPVNRSNTLLKPPQAPKTTTLPGSNKTSKRFVDPEVFDEFKQAILDSSNLTKMGLCEILKVKFPKQKKDAIKDTLDAVAERVGPKVTEKRWVLKGN